MTRYPKSGKGHRWTVAELKALAPTAAGDTLRDGDGLAGTVRGDGAGRVGVHFRYGFKRDGKKAWHYCGTWPATSLERVRAARDEARSLLKRGLDPNESRTAERIESRQRIQATIEAEARRLAENASIGEMYSAWLADGVSRKDGNAEIRRSFEKDVLPTLGAQPVRTVTEHDLRGVLRALVARGVNRMAVNLFRDIKQMFAWAEKRQPWRRLLLEGNPTNLIEIERIVAADYDMSNIRTRVLSPGEIRELKAIFEQTQAAYDTAPDKRKATRCVQTETQLALWICLATCCRIGELLMTEWRHVNLNAATWFIPKENVKGARGKQHEQLVYLSDFALEKFKALQTLSGDTDWCFPARDAKNHVCLKSVSKQIGDRQLRFKNRRDLNNRCNDDSLVVAGGSNGEWTPHDLRRTAATMMQALGLSPEVIDRCQNHVLAGSRVRRHYLKHEYNDEKRAAWQLLGVEIERILGQPNPTLPVIVSRQQSKDSSGELSFHRGDKTANLVSGQSTNETG